jgi:hypothetical protein
MAVETRETEEYKRGMLSAIGSTDRIRKLNQQLHSTPQTICLHRARAYTRIFAETEGEPLVLRNAKAFRKAPKNYRLLSTITSYWWDGALAGCGVYR